MVVYFYPFPLLTGVSEIIFGLVHYCIISRVDNKFHLVRQTDIKNKPNIEVRARQ